MKRARVNVTVIAEHFPDGSIRPLHIQWEDGSWYRIDRLLRACPAASYRGGGLGTRYTCEIRGKHTYLWDEYGVWFVERRETFPGAAGQGG